MTFGRKRRHTPGVGGSGRVPGAGVPGRPSLPTSPPMQAVPGHPGGPAYGPGGRLPVYGAHPSGGAPSPHGAPTPYGQVPHAQVPHAQVPHAQVPHAQLPHAQLPHAQVPSGTPSVYGPPSYGVRPHPYAATPSYVPPAPGYTPPAERRRREPAPAGGPVTDEDERWAVPAYVGMFVSGFVAPAIVYFAKGRTSPFARFHAVQALNLCIAMTVCDLAVYGLLYVIGFAGLFVALAVIAAECFCVVRAAIGANRCEWYRLPSIVAWPILR